MFDDTDYLPDGFTEHKYEEIWLAICDRYAQYDETLPEPSVQHAPKEE